jgi:hypothetical protein
MRTRIHPPCEIEEFKALCVKLGLRVDAWSRDEQAGVLTTHAWGPDGSLERHVIYQRAERVERTERAERVGHAEAA